MATAALTRDSLTGKDIAKAIGVGILTAILLSLIMVPAFKAGISPMPNPLGLAFAQTLLGKVPLPVGLLFHLLWVTTVSTLYLAFIQRQPTFGKVLAYGLLLWVLVLLVFFPLVGWGFLGLGVSSKLIIASLVPHVLFVLFLWGLGRWAFGKPRH